MALALNIVPGSPTDQVGHLRWGSLRVTRTDGNRAGRCDFTLTDLVPPLGAEVTVVDGATTYFTGVVTSRIASELVPGHVTCQVSCADDGAVPSTTEAPFALTGETWSATYSQLMHDLDPFSWWPLGEPAGSTAFDIELRQDGTYQGSPTLYVDGVIGGKGITLNGSSQYVQVGTNNLRGQASFTVSVWAKSSVHGTQALYAERASPATNAEITFYLDSNGRPALSYRDNAGTFDSITCGSGDWCDNAWHHFVLVKNGSNVALYVDGIARRTTSLSAGDTLTGTLQAHLGTVTGGGLWFAGSVDEVAIWQSDIGGAGIKSIYAMRDVRRFHSIQVSAIYDPDLVTERHTTEVSTLDAGLAPGQELTVWPGDRLSDGWWQWQAPPINEVTVEWLNAATPKWTATIGDPLPRLAKKF